jgi:hypothetical protein
MSGHNLINFEEKDTIEYKKCSNCNLIFFYSFSTKQYEASGRNYNSEYNFNIPYNVLEKMTCGEIMLYGILC